MGQGSKKPRGVELAGDVAFVSLSKGYITVIDAEDAERIGAFSWTASERRGKDGRVRAVYAFRRGSLAEGRAIIYLHRDLMSASPGREVDHRDGDSLNNRKSNLRSATHQENMRNTRLRADNKSGAKGVCWWQDRQKWVAYIKENGKTITLGYFASREAAQDAYASASARLHGEFGRVA